MFVQWTDTEFNGAQALLQNSGYDFTNAVVDKESTFTPTALSTSSDGQNLYIDMTGVSYSPTVALIINLCGKSGDGDCSSHSTCDSCATAGCEFCLDTNTCSKEPGTCHNYIGKLFERFAFFLILKLF